MPPPSTSEELLVRVLDALAQDIALMLDEGVVATAQDMDLCMLTGAGRARNSHMRSTGEPAI